MDTYTKARQALVIKALRSIVKENNYEKKDVFLENGSHRIIYKIPANE